MSKTRFTRLRRPSPGATSRATTSTNEVAARQAGALPASLADAASHLATVGVYGLVWTDPDLVARERFGSLVDFVTLGVGICRSVLPLFGMEDQLASLKRRPASSFQLPNVSIVTAGVASPRLNITVFWRPRAQGFLVLVSRALARDDLEIELTRQTRSRMLTEARLLEQSQAIVRANEELLRANSDLAEFATIVSHDLKAPLRAVRYHAEDLERALADPANSETQRHIDQLQFYSRRMSAMLTSLLHYVRIDDKREAAEPVDTHRLIQDVMASAQPRAGLSLEISGEWPLVTTHVAPLDMILRNLIENALKHHDLAEGRVVAHCEPRAGGLVLTVADDGPGIPAELHGAAFQPFTRLGRERPETDGVGMGLALVQRAVTSAGATLTLVSDPAQRRGTEIIIDWPC